MATPEAQAALAAHQALLEELDIHAIHKTFRNSHWRPNQRRNKNIKTILGDASRKEASAAATSQENSGANSPNPAAAAAAAATVAAANKRAKTIESHDDNLSTSGTATPVIVVGGASAAGGSSDGLLPNLAQASRSLSKLVLEKSLRPPSAALVAASLSASAPTVTYTNVESAPSLAPQRRYCDITGLKAPYTDPKTRLRYHNSEVFAAIHGFQQGVAEQYLEMRGAHTVLK